MAELTPAQRIIVALDLPEADAALRLAERLAPHVGAVKVGLELFNSAGPDILRQLVDAGAKVFYDAKLHDIPNTVKRALAAAAQTGVWMINVHASGGSAMMRAAMEAAWAAGERAPDGAKPKVLAVTLLTSLGGDELRDELGVPAPPEEQVVRLARLAQASGVDGVVASPLEAALVRRACGEGFLIVTPGVRPAGSDTGDQRRIATPADALAAGADYLVIGRPITRASDPVAAAQRIAEEMA